MDVIVYACWDYNESFLAKGDPDPHQTIPLPEPMMYTYIYIYNDLFQTLWRPSLPQDFRQGISWSGCISLNMRIMGTLKTMSGAGNLYGLSFSDGYFLFFLSQIVPVISFNTRAVATRWDVRCRMQTPTHTAKGWMPTYHDHRIRKPTGSYPPSPRG